MVRRRSADSHGAPDADAAVYGDHAERIIDFEVLEKMIAGKHDHGGKQSDNGGDPDRELGASRP